MGGCAMSEQYWEELGRRAVACRHWRWLPGMTYVFEDASEAEGPCWEDHSDDEECGGGRHWSERCAEEYTAWRMPTPVYTYKGDRWHDGWACYAESVLRGARTVDLPGTKFNPYSFEDFDYVGGFHDNTAIGFPDFTDPATLGCLLALVREAWQDPTIGAVQASDYKTKVPNLTIPSRSHWLVMRAGPVGLDVHNRGTTEAEALVKALEAAP